MAGLLLISLLCAGRRTLDHPVRLRASIAPLHNREKPQGEIDEALARNPRRSDDSPHCRRHGAPPKRGPTNPGVHVFTRGE